MAFNSFRRRDVPRDFFAFLQFIWSKTHDHRQVFCLYYNHRTMQKAADKTSGQSFEKELKESCKTYSENLRQNNKKHVKSVHYRSVMPKALNLLCILPHASRNSTFWPNKKSCSSGASIKEPLNNKVLSITNDILWLGLLKCMEKNFDITNQFP